MFVEVQCAVLCSLSWRFFLGSSSFSHLSNILPPKLELWRPYTPRNTLPWLGRKSYYSLCHSLLFISNQIKTLVVVQCAVLCSLSWRFFLGSSSSFFCIWATLCCQLWSCEDHRRPEILCQSRAAKATAGFAARFYSGLCYLELRSCEEAQNIPH